MKKIIVICTFLILQTALHAQQHWISAAGGLNLSRVNGQGRPADITYVHGLHAGAQIERRYESMLNLTGGLFYNRRGYFERYVFTDEYGGVIADTDVALRIDYITADLKVGFRTKQKLAGFVNLGLSPGYRIQASYYAPEILDSTQMSGWVIDDVTSRIRPFDLMLLAEGGLGYSTDKVGFFASCNFSRGILPVFTMENSNTDKIYNNSICFSAGISMRLPNGIENSPKGSK